MKLVVLDNYNRVYKEIEGSQLSKPAMSFKEILQLGVMVFMIIAIIGEYYVVQQQHAATLAYIKPLNASINQNNVLIHVLQNQTKALDKLLGLNITK